MAFIKLPVIIVHHIKGQKHVTGGEQAMSKKPTTIKDIALQLNISVATVSRALRNSSEIKRETKLAVLKAAKEMDYHPNLLASSLSSKKSRILGVVVPTINRQFWSNAISGIENIAYQKGYKVMIFQSAESYQKEMEIVEILANSRVEGILMAFSKETARYDHVQGIMARGIPVVFFERVSDLSNASRVITDDYYGARQIVQHLVDRGKKKIAYLGGPLSLAVCKERHRGYRDVLTENGLGLHEAWQIEVPEFSYENAEKGFRDLWGQTIRPDALFCFADILAIGALHAARKLGIEIPNQLAVTGFGNDDTGKFVTPSITTMAQPSFEIGQHAARLMLEQINSERDDFVFKTEIVQPRLLVRESS